MRDILSPAAAIPTSECVVRVLIWVLFFASSAYGHLALKLAVNETDTTYRRAMLNVATSFWGWSTVAAWTFLGERVTAHQCVGIGLIVLGILFVK